jgi:uncharacterized protein YceK
MSVQRAAWVMGALIPLLLFGGCATSETHQADSEAYRREQEAGGTLPWNRPQSWEGAGAIGNQINEMNR